jgi:DNA-binding transcriptional regulator YdaS (Cro superfamily)
MSHAAFKRALAACEDNQSELARRIGTSQQRVHYLVTHEKSCPAELVLACERETGVPKEELRPDLYGVEQEAA